MVWNSSTYITSNCDSRNVLIRIRFSLKLVNLDNFKLRFIKCVHKNSVLCETCQFRKLQSETQQMSSSEFSFVWNSSTYTTSNWDTTNLFITIRFYLNLVNLDNFKLRLKKCLHNNLIFFEIHRLTSLQTEAQEMSS